jgi:hypothetical protein
MMTPLRCSACGTGTVDEQANAACHESRHGALTSVTNMRSCPGRMHAP